MNQRMSGVIHVLSLCAFVGQSHIENTVARAVEVFLN